MSLIFIYILCSANRNSEELFFFFFFLFFLFLLASFLLICRYNTEETQQTLVAIMLGEKWTLVEGRRKQTCPLFPLLQQRDVRTDFGTDAVLIETAQPSRDTFGHFFQTETGLK